MGHPAPKGEEDEVPIPIAPRCRGGRPHSRHCLQCTHSRTSPGVKTATPTGYSQLWWSNSTDKKFEPDQGDVAETTLNFFLNTVSDQSNLWFKDAELTEATAVAPQGRYLMVVIGAGESFANTNTFSETAFVGYAIPEPASLSPVALGALTFLRRRPTP